ncbi:MAG TPA: alpha/beta hydrolase [Mycobacteriales bacterium]|nr:alpha/beta hydrolase [Mycobacteriales bacterium]
MSTRRRLGVAALATGAASAAIAGVIAVEHRAIGRARKGPDPYADEPLGSLHTPGTEVALEGDVTLHVEIDGDRDSPLTVVFAHGYALSMDSFHFQRRDLGGDARLVFYDQRSHGRSGRSARADCTIEQLGEDLYSVLAAVAPSGPVVLVGHSMGGMTVLSLAGRHPELVGDRVVGVALLSTSTGDLAKQVLGVPGWLSRLVNPAVPQVAKVVRSRAATLERNRKIGSDVAYLFTRHFSFAADAPPSLVHFMERMLTATSVEVMSDFFDAFLSHDAVEALSVLSDVPVLISCGDRDLLTPLSHSELMAAMLPDAELQILSGANHMAILERYPAVNAALRRLFERALGGSSPQAIAG